MKFLCTFLATLVLTATTAVAQAACSVERIQTDQPQVAAALQTIGAKDPNRLQELADEMQAQMTAMQTGGGDMNEICALFDRVLAEAES